MPLTTEEQIDIGRLCGMYASNEIASGRLAGGQIDRRLPHLIYAYTQGLVWADELSETTQNLNIIGNGLIQICRHVARAQGVLAIGGGGTVAPINPSGGNSVNALDFEVSASSIIPTGGSTLLLDGTNGVPDYRGYKIVNFIRGGVGQNTTSLGDGSSYYAWNSVTGLFSCFPALSLGELIRITPDAVGGGTSSGSSNTPDTIILSTDGTYTLAQGYQIWKITINPSVADDVKIGTTANGDEVMLEKTLTAGVYGNNGVTADVFAESGAVTIYFTGFTGAATINIYTLPI